MHVWEKVLNKHMQNSHPDTQIAQSIPLKVHLNLHIHTKKGYNKFYLSWNFLFIPIRYFLAAENLMIIFSAKPLNYPCKIHTPSLKLPNFG